MAELLSYLSPTMLIAVVFIGICFAFFFYYWRATRIQDGSLAWIKELGVPRRLSFHARRHPMARRDALPLLLITAVYALTAFWNLGYRQAPESYAVFTDSLTVEFTLHEPVTASSVVWFPGLSTGDYELEVSEDGESWFRLLSTTDENDNTTVFWHPAEEPAPEGASNAVTQRYKDLFKWMTASPEEPVAFSQFRLHASRNTLELGELAFLDGEGAIIDLSALADSPLFDEQDVLAAVRGEGQVMTYLNSSYFDEIYHPRTAYEHIRGIYPYEVSHPPLGKLIISLGIRAFGMNPFGWRFMGTLLGVLMLPMLYVFLKNLFGKTAVAACGTALFAFDFMHLTQTRLATIDTYGVLFLLGAYFFLYRWMTAPPAKRHREERRADLNAGNLFLSGLFFGLGVSSKWTVLYGAVGMAALYFLHLFLRWRDWPREQGAPRYAPWLVKTLLLSVVFFLVIPACIYAASYLPYAMAKGDTSLSGLFSVLWENQKFMLSYHSGVTTPHPYASHWYQWLFDVRPILYYRDLSLLETQGVKSAFAAFLNPVVCWAGLLSVIITAVEAVRKRCGKALFLTVGYLSQFVPYLFISRPMFYYHYFASMLFLVLCIAYAMNGLLEKRASRAKLAIYGLTGCTVGLYAAFYPVLVGLYVPAWYTTNLLRWFPSWPF